ncbi:MAG: FAD:protein FMN transferase [Sedimentisphaerales bacterium]
MTHPQMETHFVKGHWDLISGIHRFSHQAMATTFEVLIQHDDASYAQQAAGQAFDELDRLESELSRFIENSDISQINNLAANQPLQIGLRAFECLQLATKIYTETGGAFDITIGSLLSCWVNEDKTMRTPSQEELDIARQRTGAHLIKLNETEHTVQLLARAVQIDLGGIGKGYALDQMAELLRDWSIDTALIHGGFSSVLALDSPAETKGWPLTLSNPGNRKQTLAYLHLQARAVSGSGLQKGQHIIDPRQARPVEGKRAAWACGPDAATADALSTAFMVMSPDEIEQYCLRHPEVQAMVIINDRDTEKDKTMHFGPWNKGDLLIG